MQILKLQMCSLKCKYLLSATDALLMFCVVMNPVTLMLYKEGVYCSIVYKEGYHLFTTVHSMAMESQANCVSQQLIGLA